MISLRVLLIEDDPRDAEVLMQKWRLRVPKADLVLARCYREAKALLDVPREFDCVCLDLKLLPDDPNGLLTLELVRQKLPGVLVIVVSGFITPERAVLFSTLGGIYVCRKGLAWEDLEPLFRLFKL